VPVPEVVLQVATLRGRHLANELQENTAPSRSGLARAPVSRLYSLVIERNY